MKYTNENPALDQAGHFEGDSSGQSVIQPSRRRKLTREEINSQPDSVIASYWQKLASFLMHNLNVNWQTACKKARELMRSGEAEEFVKQTRIKVGQQSIQFTSNNNGQTLLSEPLREKQHGASDILTGLNTGESDFTPVQPYTENFHKLLQIVPELDLNVQLGKYKAVSKVFGNERLLDFQIELVYLMDDGRYLVHICHLTFGGNEGKPSMLVLLDRHKRTLEAHSIEDQQGTKDVYSIHNGVTHTNHSLKRELNEYLSKWLSNLITQGHLIENEKGTYIPVEETLDYWQQKYYAESLKKQELEDRIEELEMRLRDLETQTEELSDSEDKLYRDREAILKDLHEAVDDVEVWKKKTGEEKERGDFMQSSYDEVINLFDPLFQQMEGETVIHKGESFVIRTHLDLWEYLAHHLLVVTT